MLFASGKINPVVRQESRNGRNYLVAPGIAVIEGVLNGEFLAKDEFAKSLPFWNGRPIVIGHPTMRGLHISANHPDITHIGRIYNAKVNGNRLDFEYWFDVTQLEASDKGKIIKANLEAEKPMEQSTGYWREFEVKPGTFNGKNYKAIQKSIRPDHVAVFADGEIGACSVHDGCGVPRVNISQEEMLYCNCATNEEQNMGEEEIKANNNIADFMQRLAARFGIKSKEQVMDELISELVANEKCIFSKDELTVMSEDTLKKLQASLAANEEESDKPNPDEPEVATSPQNNQEQVPAWAQQLTANMGKLTSRFDALEQRVNQPIESEKAALITGLVANAACPFAEAELKGFDLATLQKLESSYKPANYAGKGGFSHNGSLEETYFEMPMGV